jgi:hypothetical protein
VPLLFALGLVLFALLVGIALMPFALVQRYRVGTARRLARGWVVTLNLAGIGLSSAIFLAGAAATSIWVPPALRYSLAGLAAGCLLGVLGLLLSRWEPTSTSLHYTPNRWLVLAITLVVAGRMFYGFYRAWEAWRWRVDSTSWLAASGAADSLAAAGIVLGYYLAYWAGLRWRLKRHERRRSSSRWSPG